MRISSHDCNENTQCYARWAHSQLYAVDLSLDFGGTICTNFVTRSLVGKCTSLGSMLVAYSFLATIIWANHRHGASTFVAILTPFFFTEHIGIKLIDLLDDNLLAWLNLHLRLLDSLVVLLTNHLLLLSHQWLLYRHCLLLLCIWLLHHDRLPYWDLLQINLFALSCLSLWLHSVYQYIW